MTDISDAPFVPTALVDDANTTIVTLWFDHLYSVRFTHGMQILSNPPSYGHINTIAANTMMRSPAFGGFLVDRTDAAAVNELEQAQGGAVILFNPVERTIGNYSLNSPEALALKSFLAAAAKTLRGPLTVTACANALSLPLRDGVRVRTVPARSAHP